MKQLRINSKCEVSTGTKTTVGFSAHHNMQQFRVHTVCTAGWGRAFPSSSGGRDLLRVGGTSFLDVGQRRSPWYSSLVCCPQRNKKVPNRFPSVIVGNTFPSHPGKLFRDSGPAVTPLLSLEVLPELLWEIDCNHIPESRYR